MGNAHAAATAFCVRGHVLAVEEHGNGNVNDTYLVTVGGAPQRHYVLQRINTHVFRQPDLIMLNLRTLTDHVQQARARTAEGNERRWVVPAVLPTVEGADYYQDGDGGFWRALTCAEDAVSYETVQGIDHAREAGYALGRFHRMISDLEPAALHDTLPGFHVTPAYLAHYDCVLAQTEVGTASPAVAHCARFVAARRDWAPVLEDLNAGALTDEQNGTLYLVNGSFGGADEPPYHYSLLTVDSTLNELKEVSFFYYPEGERWEEIATFTRADQ